MSIFFNTDSYKLSHRHQYPQGTEVICSNLTARKSRIDGVNEVVVFGIQKFVQDLMKETDIFFLSDIDQITEEYVNTISKYLNIPKENVETDHIESLWKLGHLPITILAMPEGSKVKIGDPILLIYNTHPDFFWLTNYLETWLSNSLWGPITSATTARRYRQILDDYAKKTSSVPDFVNWQGHDFSMRGMWGNEAAAMSGAAHLLYFNGTDTIPAVKLIEHYYQETPVAGSVPASEHSTMTTGAIYNNEEDLRNGELEVFKRFINELYPHGIVSIVSDSYDYWKVLTDFIPILKDDILKRNGKVVIRPDSGDPVDIICGIQTLEMSDKYPEEYIYTYAKNHEEDITSDYEYGRDQTGQNYISWNGKYFRYKYKAEGYDISIEEVVEVAGTELAEVKGSIETLWEIFGGTVNEKGYKELDSHIGLIYGDSITVERAKEICRRLEKKGFASTNVVFGIGSYTYTYATRDTYGIAIKATFAIVNGQAYQIFKDPKGDTSKKSHRGIPIQWETGVTDGHNLEDLKKNNLYKPYMINGYYGELENWSKVKERAMS